MGDGDLHGVKFKAKTMAAPAASACAPVEPREGIRVSIAPPLSCLSVSALAPATHLKSEDVGDAAGQRSLQKSALQCIPSVTSYTDLRLRIHFEAAWHPGACH
jgi:hypothetical protein